MVDPAASDSPTDRDPPLADLVVIMAHDLKNALAALSANLHFLEGALGETSDDDASEAVFDSTTLCLVLDHLLRNLDLLGRYERLAVRKDVTSLRTIASEVVGRFQKQAKSAGVDIALKLGSEGDVLAFVDRDLFARAVDNIVTNAIENAPRGSRVLIELSSNEREVTLTVTDAREGAPPSMRPPAPTSSGTGRSMLDGQKGRGLALYCAGVAARASGARFEQGGRPGECQLHLVAPTRP